MKHIINSDAFARTKAKSDEMKQTIYNMLLSESLSRRVCSERLKLTKNQFKHHIEYLIKNKHVKFKSGACSTYGNKKVHIMSSNAKHPFVAQTFDEIKAERAAEIARQKIVNKHTRVFNLLDRKEHNHVKLSGKSHVPSLQSCFSMF